MIQRLNKKAFTLIEMTVVIGLLAILVGLVAPNVNNITDSAKDTIAKLNEKVFKQNSIMDIALGNQTIRISETVNLSTIGEVQDVTATYNGSDTLHLLVSTDGGNTWYSYDMSGSTGLLNTKVNAVDLNWEAVDSSTPESIQKNALNITDFNNLTQTEWLKILENAETVTFAYSATDSEGNDITQEINPELSIVVTGANGDQSVVFPNNNSSENTDSIKPTDQISTTRYRAYLLSQDNKLYKTGPKHGESYTSSDLDVEPRYLGLDNIKQVASGQHHTLILNKNGEVYGVGENGFGQLGLGESISDALSFQKVNISNVAHISAGHAHTLFLLEDGTVKATGQNISGELGLGDETQRNTPVQIPGLTNVEKVFAGYGTSVFVLSDGTVKGCGRNTNYILGLSQETNYTTLQSLPVSNIKQVAINHYEFGLFVKNDGTLMISGNNYYVSRDLLATSSNPNKIAETDIQNVKQVTATQDNALILKDSGEVYGVGKNSSG